MLCTCEIVFIDSADRSKKEYLIFSVNEKALLNKRLWELNKDLDVVAYQADDDNLEETLRWKLQGHWYTPSEIERIYKIRAFL